MWIRIATGLSLLCAALLASCGGRAPTPDAERDASASLQLHVLAASFLGADSSAAGFALSSRLDGDELLVDITAQDARNLRALYYEIEYDGALLNPLVAGPAALFGNADETLSLLQVTGPGQLQAGQVLIHPDGQAGFSGDGSIASLHFALEPQAAMRAAGKVNDKQAAIPRLLKWNNASQTVSWYYNNPADYDQNGEVNVADLTPLAQNFLSAQPGGFDVETAQSVVDGDGNGLINLADITPIGVNFGNGGSGGYAIFEKIGAGTTQLGNVLLNEAVGDRSQDRLAFSYSPAAPLPGNGYFVRLDDGLGNLGFQPAPVFVPADNPPFIVLDFLDKPAQGTGTQPDPYILTDAIIGNSFTFRITDEGLDVTGGAGVEIRSSDAGAVLDINQSSGEVQFDPLYTDTQFSMDGISAGSDTQNSIHFIYVPDAVVTIFIMPDPADPDWAAVEGDGLTAETAYKVRNLAFNSNGQTEFSFIANSKADGSGDVIDVGTLTWQANIPPPNFIINGWVPAGTAKFHPTLTDGYVFAKNGDGVESNHIYVVAKALP